MLLVQRREADPTSVWLPGLTGSYDDLVGGVVGERILGVLSPIRFIENKSVK